MIYVTVVTTGQMYLLIVKYFDELKVKMFKDSLFNRSEYIHDSNANRMVARVTRDQVDPGINNMSIRIITFCFILYLINKKSSKFFTDWILLV